MADTDIDIEVRFDEPFGWHCFVSKILSIFDKERSKQYILSHSYWRLSEGKWKRMSDDKDCEDK